MKYDVVLFDLDGTLMDFKQAETMSFYATFTSYGINIADDVYLKYIEINKGLWSLMEKGEISRDELLIERFSRLFNEFGCDLDPIEFNKDYLYNLSFGSFLMDGTVKLLESLKNKARLAIVTNGVSSSQFRRLDMSGIKKYFEAVIVSEDTGYQKPNSQFFKYAFEKLQNPDKKRTLIVGDSLIADIFGGKNFGISTCWYNPEKISLPKDATVPDYIATHLSQVEDIILKENLLEG